MYVFLINFILVCWALHQFSKLNSLSAIRIQKMEEPGTELKQYLWSSVLLGFLAINWRSEFINQSRLWRSQIWDFRRFLFSSAQTVLSFFWIVCCFVLFLELGSYVFWGFAFGVWAISQVPQLRDKVWIQTLSPLIYLALTFFFLEIAFKNSGLLMQYLLETEIVFWLTVDSALNLLGILFVATVVGFLLPVQGWSLVLSFLLYLNSQASFLAFIFIMVGELTGTVLSVMSQIRAWDNFYQKKIKGLLIWLLVYLAFFVVAAYVWRYFFSFGGSYNQLGILKWIYLATVFVLLAGLYLTVMTWGHFTAAKQDRDVAVSDAGLIPELNASAVDRVIQFIVSQLHQRHEKLLGYRTELQKDPDSRKKIPPFVLSQFEAEIKIIESLKS